MGHRKTSHSRVARTSLALCAAALFCLALASSSASAATLERPFQGYFGPAHEQLFSGGSPGLRSLAFDGRAGDLLAFNSGPANETQELTIEADSELGGTYALEFEGEKTGWQGEATLAGREAGTGDFQRYSASGKGFANFALWGPGNLSSGSTVVSGLAVIIGAPEAGAPIEAEGIPPGATIVSCSPSCSTSATELTLSAPATQTASGRAVHSPGTTIEDIATESGAFQVGETIEDAEVKGIPPGATIVSCSPSCGAGATELTISDYVARGNYSDLRAGSPQLTGLTGGLFAEGDAIWAAGLQTKTTVESCSPSCASPTSLTISKLPTQTAAGASLYAGSLEASAMHTTSGAPTVGEQLSGTGILPGTLVTAVDEGAGSFTLDRPPSASGTSTDLEADLPASSAAAAPRTTQRVLEALPAIGARNVGVDPSGGGSATKPGFPQAITFTGALQTRPLPLISCDPAGLSGTNATCDVSELQRGHRIGLFRFDEEGEPAPFSALGGENVIDGQRGYGGLPCAEEPSSCDEAPKALEPSGAIAVDESATATGGDIYITQKHGISSTQGAVDVFGPGGGYLGRIAEFKDGPAAEGAEKALGRVCGVAVGPSGSLYVADEVKIHKYSVAAGPPFAATSVANFSSVSQPCALAAGAGPSEGALFAVSAFGSGGVTGGPVSKLDAASGAVRYVAAPGRNAAAAVDPADGRLFVDRQDEPYVDEYDASGASEAKLLSRAPLVATATPAAGIAANPATGDLYVAQAYSGGLQRIETFARLAEPGAVTGEISGLAETAATLNGTVTPNGSELESCSFEWGLAGASYEHVEPCVESTGEIGAGREPAPVHLDLSGLAPGSPYHYRLLASNPVGASAGADREFFTPGPPAIEAEAILEVTASEALLRARVQPRGFPTSYRVEYGTTQAYGHSSAAKPLGFSDGAFHTVTVRLSGLTPHATYHWRFTAENTDPSLPGTGEARGEDRSLATFAVPAPEGGCANESRRSGAAAYLPDCRAYELVSPLQKGNADVVSPTEGTSLLKAALEESSESGDKLAYGSSHAFADPASSPYVSQYIAHRDAAAGEWVTHSIDPPRSTAIEKAASQLDTEFKAFSPDLCQAWERTVAEPPLSRDARAGWFNLYRRTDSECGGRSYEALTTIAPAETALEVGPAPELQGASPDGQTAIYLTTSTLPDTGAPAALEGKRQLYAQGPAGTRFACVRPDGSASAVGCTAGTFNPGSGQNRSASLAHAISADGTKVFWTEAENGPGPIYLRENPLGDGPESPGCASAGAPCTLAVSEAGEAESGEAGAQFWGAAADGSRAIFSVGVDLYEYVTASRETSPIAGQALGVAGMSEDATAVYFASREALPASGANSEGAEAIADRANLYLRRAGAGATFVATLAEGDLVQGASGFGPLESFPVNHAARTSADGAQLVFDSLAGPASGAAEGVPAPTGYDNTDRNSGQADFEAYLYHASANGGKGTLVCASCNPSGGRPAGRELTDLPFMHHYFAAGIWVAGMIPIAENTLYAPRVLSADGRRLFFTSADVLSPRDSNGAADVYQWEAPGEGSCTESSPSFSALNGGCVDLISSGTSPRDTEFRDASASGNDVFVGTLASLVPWDYGLVDVYDARVGGGLPGPASPPAECEGEACQSPSGAPTLRPGGTATHHGPGNVKEGASRAARCTRPARRAGWLSRRARKLRRGSRRLAPRAPHRAQAMRRRAVRYTAAARRQSKRATRCRARARADRKGSH